MTHVDDQVEWKDGLTLPLRWYGDGDDVVVVAHGAGTGQEHPSIIGICQALAERGVRAVSFDFPYRTRGPKRPPDRLPVLISAYTAVVDHVRPSVSARLVIGGRSMGGRVATHVAANGVDVDGVVAHAYPLHPPGRPDKLRVEHLPSVKVPMLFFNPTRDALATQDLVDRHLRTLTSATVIDLVDADHSFRGKAWPSERLHPFLADATVKWVKAM